MQMRNIKEGDKLQIHCYKHDGSIHRICDEATVLKITDKILVCANDKANMIETADENKKTYYNYRTKEPAILFFYKDKWYNIIAQIKEKGIYYYCNIASPYIIDDGLIKYIDYDLDLRIFPDGAFKVLDRNEYRYHKRKMNYSKDLDKIIQYELTNLINEKKQNQQPFVKECIQEYLEKYKKLNNKSAEK